MSNFTKGEWIVYDKSSNWGRIGYDELIVGMSSYNQDYSQYYCCHKILIESSEEEAVANANLIAAAPDMYKMLEQLMNGEGLTPGDTIERLLAKARGEL